MPLGDSFKVMPRNVREWGRFFRQLSVTPDHGSADTTQIADDAVTTSKIDDESVTLAKLQHIATDSLLGRTTAANGDVEVLTAAKVADILETVDWVYTGEVQLNGTVGFFGVTPTSQIANIPDAVAAHSLTDADANLDATTQAEIEGVLDALGAKINIVIAALETIGITAT